MGLSICVLDRGVMGLSICVCVKERIKACVSDARGAK